MRATVLERLFVTERLRRRSTTAGFAVPGLFERQAFEHEGPFLVSNMRSGFTLTRRSSDGAVRHGFSEVSPEDEDGLLAELYQALWSLGEQHKWPNRCNSIEQARARLAALDLAPEVLVVPFSLVEEVCGEALTSEDVEKLMVEQGFVARISDEIRVLVAELPEGAAMLCHTPLGFYTRIDNWLGLLVQQAHRNLILVGGDDLA